LRASCRPGLSSAASRQLADAGGQSGAAGGVRVDVRPDDVLALLAATCQGALHGGWDHDLQQRTLSIVFAGPRAESLSRARRDTQIEPPGTRRAERRSRFKPRAVWLQPDGPLGGDDLLPGSRQQHECASARREASTDSQNVQHIFTGAADPGVPASPAAQLVSTALAESEQARLLVQGLLSVHGMMNDREAAAGELKLVSLAAFDDVNAAGGEYAGRDEAARSGCRRGAHRLEVLDS